MISSALAAMMLAGSASAQTLPSPAPAPQPGAASAVAAPSLAATTTPAPAGSDTCGATALASLVGQSRSAIPIADDISKRRVVCTTCPRTQDYLPDRLTIFFDAPSGKVTTLQCG